MINDQIKHRIENATITVTEPDGTLKGRGVLVPGRMIITAAHCINVSTTGRLALGDWHVERFRPNADGVAILKAALLMIEPMTDIAIMESLDGQHFYDEDEQFEAFCETAAPVPIFTGEFEPIESVQLPRFKSLDVYIFTHENTWISGTATNYSLHSTPYIVEAKWNGTIKSGTSGSPIVLESGQLFGVMSHSERIFVLGSCLPRYILDRVETGKLHPTEEFNL